MTKSREKFVELAEKRVRKALKDIELIGNLSNKSNYEYSDSDVNQIISALENSLKELKGRFRAPSGRRSEEFTLK